MAGSLFYTEEGHVISTACEELTRYRRARKLLHLLPGATGSATLYILVRRYHDFSGPLHMSVNGHRFDYLAAEGQEHLHWAQVALPPGVTIRGENVIEFW